MGRLSLELCTTAARYRALQTNIFGHPFAAKFEIISLQRLFGHNQKKFAIKRSEKVSGTGRPTKLAKWPEWP
jgi:hypothetical protein